MKASLVWEKLLINNRKIVTSNELQQFAREISWNEDQLIDYLWRNEYLERILRGVYYVKSIEERERKSYDHTLFERIAMALKEKDVKNWYFGLETALKLNLMTHEYYMIDYVITDSFRTTKVISIANQKFKYIKRGTKHFQEGIVREKMIRYSNPQKTILDIAYRNYLKNKNQKTYLDTIMEHRNRLTYDIAQDLLKPYPKAFRNSVVNII